MPSDGERIERHLRVVRVYMDAHQSTFDTALEQVVQADDREQVRARWQAETDQPIQRTRVLSATGGPRPYFADYDPATGYYWVRLRRHLLDTVGRSTPEIESLDDASDKVLSHIEDPRDDGPPAFNVRGLVLGYIQSGKTANIAALIAKAADLGYKLVVVLSGMDDGLRQQTQRRLNRELGLTEDPKGVGRPEHGKRWVSLTTDDLKGDFNPGSVDSSVLQGNEKVIAVVKKNVYVLRKLVGWMEGAPAGLPALVIDDEADQASINTGGNRGPLDTDDEDDVLLDEEDPSKINGLIRQLLSRFNRVSYVAYTATPFANVLIDPAAEDREVLGDLYPRDFIVPLPKSPAYTGAERLFGRDAFYETERLEGIDVVREIPDHEIGALVPRGRAAGGFSARMCDSLESALVDFVLAASAKETRKPGPATMLIHTSHRTLVHNSLATLVKDHLTGLRQSWRYDRNSVEPHFRARWEEDFRPVTVSVDAAQDAGFEEIVPEIDRFFRDPPDVRVLNVTSSDELDYEVDPDLKVVVIGGNRLSRGLTLDGLVVSYYVRPAANYDTLLQMGRWFGYRDGYVDLTRLWTTDELFSRFRHLALVEEEFRDQLEVYERNHLTPMDFGPRIRTHPGMAITSVNKMGVGRTVKLNFAAQLRQTSRFHLDDLECMKANLEATRDFFRSLGSPTAAGAPRPEWTGVSWEQVVSLLGSYTSAQDPDSFDSAYLGRYIREQATAHGELVRWHVAVPSRKTALDRLGTVDLGIDGIPEVNTIERSRLEKDPTSVGVLTNPPAAEGALRQGDEELGLSDDQILEARRLRAAGEFSRLGMALRSVRSPEEGLLLIYPISARSRGGGEGSRRSERRIDLYREPAAAHTVIGLALAFPVSQSSAAVEYVAGPAGRREDDDDGE